MKARDVIEPMASASDVDGYIAAAPAPTRPMLAKLRAAIRRAAPEAVESISYGMPFYSFKGESGFGARLCYFGLVKGAVTFSTRPTYLEEYADEVAAYMSTASTLHFRLSEPIPARLIQKLVTNAVRKHSAGSGGRARR